MSDESGWKREYLSPNSLEMALATAGHLDYPAEFEARRRSGEVAAKVISFRPWPLFSACFLPCFEKSKFCDGVFG